VIIRKPIEFLWDEGNQQKNWLKHKVKTKECEEVFLDDQKKIAKDKFHSKSEPRFILLGKNKKMRLIYLIFTTRSKKIRVISARDINKKERKLYEKTT